MKHAFLNNPYEKYKFFYNSSKNKRGVGILVKNSIDFECLDTRLSEDENAILLHCRLLGSELLIVSIYGPNSTDLEFFNTLRNWFLQYPNIPLICGGDWNATYCNSAINENIDCLNMVRPPNLTHSNKILELCDEFNLSDPFRLLNPDKIEFTYCPRYANAQNRSRIDFFIVSENLNNSVRESKISTSLQNKLFDHKAVTVVFNKKSPRNNKRFAISSSCLEDDLLTFLVHATVAETYILHRERQQGQGNAFVNMLNTCGTIKALIRDSGPPLDLIVGLDIRETR
jgi:exonuclease III